MRQQTNPHPLQWEPVFLASIGLAKATPRSISPHTTAEPPPG
jgi:hypothetical protein